MRKEKIQSKIGDQSSLLYICLQTLMEGQAAYAHVNEIIKELKKNGWSVSLIQPNSLIVASAMEKSTGTYSVLRKLCDFLVSQLKIKQYIASDVVYARFHFATIISFMIAKFLNRPIVFEVNGPFDDLFIAWPIGKYIRRPLEYIMRVQLKHADYLVTVTAELANWLNNVSGHNRISVIPNGANIEIFKKTVETDYAAPYVIFFGALTRWQGIDTIINAAKSAKWPPNLKVYIVGDGEMREAVLHAAKENKKIVYIGKKSYSELPDLISGAIASISVQNNTADRGSTGLSPLKVYESLACSTPVIAGNFPGIADLINESRSGIVIEPENSDLLAEAVNTMVKNPELSAKMGRNGMDEVILKHTWASRAHDTEIILKKVVRS